MKKTLFTLLLVVALVFWGSACVPAPAACPDTLTVTTNLDVNDGACTGGHCSLREAVIAANACAGFQTILVPAGNYQLTILGRDEDAAATGDLDITDDVLLQGEGVPSIDGVTEDRLLEIMSTAVVKIDQFILMNGLEQLGGAILSHGDLTLVASSIHNNNAEVPVGGSGASAGGGIFVESGTTTVINTDIFENFADFGGGVHNFATATFSMTGGHLIGNIATGWGGGLWNNMAAQATLEDVEVSMNTASERGAGIYNNGVVETNRVTLNQNIDAAEGGGVYNDDNGEMYMTMTWFTNNSAGMGGAIFNRGLLHLYQSSLTINTALAGFGGAIYNDGGSSALLVSNTTISGNMIVPFAAPGGSGIYNNEGEVRLEFATLAYNNADGIYNDGGHVTMRSSILAYHALVNCFGVAGGSQGYNLEDGDSCGLIEPTDLIDTDPWLAGLAMNGGITLNHALNPSSPAIDSGDPDRCIDVDQRGVSRPQGLGCDRGAYEAETGTSTPISTPTALALANVNCRKGPGMEYDSMAMLTEGLSYEINARSQYSDWWRIILPNGLFCWAADTLLEVSDGAESVQVIIPLPDATDTPILGCWNIPDGQKEPVCTVPCPPDAQPGGACTP